MAYGIWQREEIIIMSVPRIGFIGLGIMGRAM